MSYKPYYLILTTALELKYFFNNSYFIDKETEKRKVNFQKETHYYMRSFTNTAERRGRD